jgi:hypothetical protein
MEYPEELYDRMLPKKSQDPWTTAFGDKPILVRGGPLEELKHYSDYLAQTSSSNLEPKQEERDADPVNHPPHYTSGGIETIDYMQAKSTPEEFRGHLRLTTLKYLSRAGLKEDTLQDLEKAAWYLDKLIEVIKAKK